MTYSTRTPRNSSGEEIRVGQVVDRLDHYKMGGKVHTIRLDHYPHTVLVRWPRMDDEWCTPELLVPREVAP